MMPTGRTLHASMVLGAALISAAQLAQSQTARWSVDAKPTLVLGRAGDGSTAEFAFANGATLLANGNVMVTDRGDYSMYIVSPAGKVLKKFARKGEGPGEMNNAFFSWRCGKKVFVGMDGRPFNVFALDGSFIEKTMLNLQASKTAAYRTACNQNGVFVHYGWEKAGEGKAETVFRALVPLWTSAGDSSAGRLIATIKGSERWGFQPQPLGRETRIAIGSDRIYVGEAESYEIKVFDLNGKMLPPITKSVKPVAVTQQDIDDDADRLIAMMGEKFRVSVGKDYARIPMPKTLPPYRELMVDLQDNLWVRDFARSGSSVTWTAFDKNGKQLSEIVLPDQLEVYEIGKDYVLGRFIDDNIGAPEIRLYRLIKK